jgi:hypothetical protein
LPGSPTETWGETNLEGLLLTGKLLIWVGAVLTIIGITLVTVAQTQRQSGVLDDDSTADSRAENMGYPTASDLGRNSVPAMVDVGNLVGVPASSGEAHLKAKGFVDVEGGQFGRGNYTVWFNRGTRQCIQVITVNGRFDSVRDVQTHPKCK